jgi:outer membrane protein OmpA-like peptidoglycan-associated protein
MRWGALLLLALALGACASRQALFVVLPNPDGTAGEITIDDGKTKVPLNRAYAAGEVRGGKAEAAQVTPQDVQSTFAGALAARPVLPSHFRLYFILDSDNLTPESQQQYRDVFVDIKRRPVYQVEVVGHTDTLGDRSYNQQLSLRRAQSIRDRLEQDGIAATAVSVAGRGQLDLAVKTADQIAEPRNRRVEITVR